MPRAGAIVMGTSNGAVRTALDAALEATESARSGLRQRGPLSVLESGKILVRLGSADGDTQAVARIAGGPAGAMIENAVRAAATLTSADVDALVRDAIPRAIAGGRAGVAAYSVESWASGRPLAELDDTLWGCCAEFLEALRRAPAPAAVADADVVTADVELLAQVASSDGRKRLERIRRLVGEELAGVSLGWAQGDFWPDNLLVEDGRLASVIDWDTASDRELPVLDALDLLGYRPRETRRTTFGPRFVASVLPLARADDPHLSAHCRAVGAPADARGREALAWAWWLRRTALTVRDYPDRRARPKWLRENVELPLNEERAP
jgi:hypothetical protein